MAKEKMFEKKEEVKSPKELRAEIAASKQKKKEEVKDIRFEFKKFFTKAKREKNIDPSLEEVIWLHFQAMGFDKIEKFNEGLKHFGI